MITFFDQLEKFGWFGSVFGQQTESLERFNESKKVESESKVDSKDFMPLIKTYLDMRIIKWDKHEIYGEIENRILKIP